jgi:hypothetical protein
VDRLGLRAVTRDLGDDGLGVAADWATSIAPIVVEVP